MGNNLSLGKLAVISSLKKNANQNVSVCHYFRGYWVGVFSKIWDKRMTCDETKCAGMGNACCEFKLLAEHTKAP